MAIQHTGSTNSRHGRKPGGPAQPIAQSRDGQIAWVLGAFARVLRPLVRLALAFGVKHAHLEEVLRDVLLDEARRAWLQKGTEPNISQLSVTTGLNRKAVTSRVRETASSLPQTEMSAEARTLTLWLQMFAENPAHRSLPIVSDDASAASFEAVARRASRGNVHHHAILGELVRLHMATVRDGMAELAVAGFVPSNDLRGMLAFLGDNVRDHLLAGHANVLAAQPPLLERSVFASGISRAECERIHQLARDRWGGLHHELTREMRRAYEAADAADSGRIRVGIYTYYEDAQEQAAAAPTAPSNASGREQP
ncbi:DUF6502 family protein [Variovorax sp. J22P271]|uniref:DUF6502 family protein n=1 Tax=Variovorax davisae TaxID=3053515 RepID=UPI0025792100|nr:DUF6502 family protein [Variovorax sp. J22P271]MDM0034739.1 DUF6502 family protein [Variovorax sp. J22P271]